MTNVIIQYLFYGTIIFGIWTALLFICFRNNYGNDQQKKIQEPESIWSLETNVHQQDNNGSEQIPKPHVRAERTSKDRLTALLGTNVNVFYSDPELAHGLLQYGFNIIISRSLGKEREVPDTRNKMCLEKHYPKYLPTASVIICFHNEEFNALFRTVSSVMNLTPHYILEEIILVDDMSEFDDLKEKLDYHLEVFRGKIKLIRNKKREGLIRARLIGASRASGDVLVFLDSHCEVNRVWLEPLLFAISKDPKVVVCPLIDVINDTTLEYTPSPVVRGAFNWKLQFKWDNVLSYEMEGPEGPTGPIRSPAMAGGIFAIQRKYFNEIGQYDKGMYLWGGENLELSLRIWMCGGQLFIIPCSRVGHISKQYIQDNFRFMQSLRYNNLRLVHVWLDEYKEQFFLQGPGLKSMNYGNISERVELRKRLGCKSFQWYLDTVFPELEASMDII
ncbi:inactive polypeptide N-acetylgalactosaminyltransferase-like protein 5 [Elephas maximus indicus]|uniref:inactive polypeptide N-acetylgalactosaminyltransferase-like protein 5 n=1 Tax=Elephas maximus indicus TaxID=99487 RepID=UPI0021165679|nr:inactive polypeptide N-acetylgalactosaminyltransferase-like protein 5 [Elephas maximus indicus]